MIIDMGYVSKVFRRIIWLALSVVALWISVKLSIFYLPFVVAFILASMIEPIIRWVKKHTDLERKPVAILVLVAVSSICLAFLIWGIAVLISEASNLLQDFPAYTEKAYHLFQSIVGNVHLDKYQIPEQVRQLWKNSAGDLLDVLSNWVKHILNSIVNLITSLPEIGIYIVITLLATYFICADRLYILDQVEHHFPKRWVRKMAIQVHKILCSLGYYLKAEAILVIIAFFQVLIGLYILKYMGMPVEYPLLAALAIGFVDALPILGSGTVIVPWAFISAINGDLPLAIGLLSIFAILSIVRQLLEPKIVSKQIGIHPIFTLIAMYTGFKAMGVLGLLIGPIALIILKNVYSTLIEKGVVKSLLELT